MKKVLHLTIKKKWFDMIASGKKKEEYRECKPYWYKRLHGEWYGNDYKHFDAVHFRNGYNPYSPFLIVECQGISRGVGNPEWGAPEKDVFIIKLGRIITDGQKESCNPAKQKTTRQSQH